MISVVIFTQNNEKVVSASITSVIKQSYTEWELIIIDNHSSDKTELMIRPYLSNRKIKLYPLKQERKFSELMNEALIHTRYHKIAFIKPGELWTADKLKNQLIYIKHPISFTNFKFIDEDDKIVNPKQSIIFTQATFNFLLNYQVIPWSSVIINKKLLENFPFTKEVAYNEYAWLLHLLKTGITAVRHDRNLLLIPFELKKNNEKVNRNALSNIYHILGLSKIKAYFTSKRFIKNQRKYGNTLS